MPPPDTLEEGTVFRELQRQKIAAWCDARPEAATLDLEEAYRELSELDAEEKSMLLLEKWPDWTMLWQETGVSAAFNLRRGQLRARANQLSRPKLRARPLGGLPLEVLRIIFDTFEDAAITEAGRGPARRLVAWLPREAYGWRRHELACERRDTVRNLRLVCSLFCDLASPLLFQTLHLHISQSSLDLVENISRSPRIASGVRGVQISLAYHPGNRAESLASYGDHCSDLFSDNIGRLLEQEMHESGDEADDQDLLVEHFSHVANEWASHVAAASSGRAEPVSEAGEILQQGYVEFCRLHEEQRVLLEDNRFVRALAAAVARMPGARSFRFVDEWEPEDEHIWASFLEAPQLLDHPRYMSRVMTRPLTFAQMEGGTNRRPARPVEMESARLLWELPISLHQAGVAMTELRVDCFPKCANVSSLFRREQDGVPAGSGPGARDPWRSILAAACQRLRYFDFMGPSDPVLQDGPLDDADKAQVDYFFGSILSACGPSLISLRISFPWTFVVPNGLWGFRETYFHAGTILERPGTMPHLQALLLCRLNLRERELRNICAKLGDGQLKQLYLLDVELQNGTWAGAVDTLRKKLAQRALALTGRVLSPVVRVSELRGGEFEGMAGEALQETERYLRGQREDNPLRATHETTV